MADFQARNWHSIFVREQPSSDAWSESDGSDFFESLESLPPPVALPEARITQSKLRARELGVVNNSSRSLRGDCRRSLRSFRSWTGASKDVLSVAWGADGSSFAVGSSADHLDRHGIPYNRNNNLLFGSIDTSRLYELPDHQITRSDVLAPSPATNTTDPKLFCAIGQVSFGLHHPTLCTAGYDKTVRVWDVTDNAQKPKCRYALPHDGFVDFAIQMPTKAFDDPQILVTGQQSRASPPIQLFGLPDSEASESELAAAYEPIATFSSDRAEKYSIFPSAIEFGPDPATRQYLLAGFAEHSDNALKEREGHLALWDVTQRSETLVELRNNIELVFDVAWKPGKAIIAAATTARNSKTLTYQQDTKSVVRTWSPRESASRVYELECPARDVNEVLFHPTRDLIIASCTDRRTYVWDFRMVDRLLMTLEHGEPIETFDVSRARPREELDVGVRFTSWAQNSRYLYSGGSDGRLLCWDMLACIEEDQASVQQVAGFDAGIMAGAFSKDESKLLLGLVKGSVEVLSVGACTKTEAAEDKLLAVSSTELTGTFEYVPAIIPDDDPVIESETLGIETARHLLQTGQLVVDTTYGIGQGPNYNGPWSESARPPGTTDFKTMPLVPDVAAQQFDKVVRRNGRARGGTSKVRQTNRILAKLYHAIVRERRQDELTSLSQDNQRRSEDRVKGPDTWEIDSLAELSLFEKPMDKSTPRSPPPDPVKGAQVPEVQSPPTKFDPDLLLPSKRAADAEFELPQRKRTQTPVPPSSRSDAVADVGQTSTRLQACPKNPAASSTGLTKLTTTMQSPAVAAVSGALRPKPPFEIIDLCSDDEEETPKPTAQSATAEFPPPFIYTKSRQATLSPVRPTSSAGHSGFRVPNTPTKTPAPARNPQTPSQRMSSVESGDTPSSQRSIVLAGSQGEKGFRIPGRVVTTPTPES